jgi:hypothetical protein
LKFNQMFEKFGEPEMQASGIVQERGIMAQSYIARREVPLLARFAGKFVLDILPAALASVIGGFLFTQYQSGRVVTRTATEQVAPASVEMMAMVRDEHAMMMDYLKSQMAAEQNRAAAEDAAARAAAEDKTTDDNKTADAVSDPPARRVTAAVGTKSAPAHAKAPVVAVAVSRAPLVIAQADVNDGAAPAGGFSSGPASLLARTVDKTLDLKDHVVAATRRVVGVIGGAISSVGERIGGSMGGAQQLSSAS